MEYELYKIYEMSLSSKGVAMSIQRSIKIFPVLIVEILMVFYLFTRCFVNMADITVDAKAFLDNIKEKTNVHYIEKEGVIFTPGEDGSKIEAYSFEMPLRAGGYEVTVDYDTDVTDDVDFETVYYPVTAHTVVGSISLVSVHTSAIDMSDVKLTAARNIASGRGYIRFGKTVPDVQLKINYSNTGKLTVKNIHIRQSRSYQFVRLFSFILICVILDALVLLFLELLEGRGKQIYKNYGCILFIAGTTCILSAPVFNNFIISGYDLNYHLMRISHIARELSYGQFPVRIYRDALDGYGYPNPLFYCDTFLYIPAVLYNLFFPLRAAYNIYVFLVNLVTVAVAFFSCRAICKDNRIAAVSTIIYTMCEWRIGRIVRGASVGGYTAFIFFPLIMVGIYNIYTKEMPEKKDRLCLAVGIAGLASCHTLSLEITVIFLGIFAVIEWRKTLKKERLISLCLSASEALLLSMYYIIPFVESYIRLPLKAKAGESYIQDRGMEFVQFIQLFYSGESIRGDLGHVSLAFGAGMIVSTVLIIHCMFISSANDEKDKRHCLGIIFIMTVLSAYMASCYFPLDMIYDNMPKFIAPAYFLLSSIQFPVRYMSMTVSILMIGVCVGLKYLKDNKKDIYKIYAWLLCIGSLTVYSVYLGYVCNNTGVEKYTASDINIDHEIMGGEYIPSYDCWTITRKSNIQVEDGIEINDVERRNGDYLFAVSNQSDKNSEVILPLFDYGNYHSESTENVYIPMGTDKYRRITLTIPAGYSGKIRVYYREPFYWRVCEIVSLTCLLLVLVSVLWNRLAPLLHHILKFCKRGKPY